MSNKQLGYVVFWTVLPFLIFFGLFLIAPGYMAHFFEQPSSACATPMLMVLVVLQILVAVSLSAGFRSRNKAVSSLPDKPASGKGRRGGIILIQIICALLVLASLWIVLLGPALLQVLQKSGA